MSDSPKPEMGRFVRYTLTPQDSMTINKRREANKTYRHPGADVSDRAPAGAQAHAGNSTHAGQVLPMLIVRVWPDEFGPGVPGVNGQVFLDGQDQHWVCSAAEGEGQGQWHWPTRS